MSTDSHRLPPTAPPAFADRRDAGRRLAAELEGLAAADPVVVALPRGGVPVAREIAAILDAPLEVIMVRKIGAPGNPEYGIGAIAEDGSRVLDVEATALIGVTHAELDRAVAREWEELKRRVRVYRGAAPMPDLRDRTVVLVDDGIATGLSDAAAIRAVRRQEPRRVILAVPVCSPEGMELLRGEADQVVALRVPRNLQGVGHWYADFSQVSDQAVIDALGKPTNAAA